MNKNYIFVIFSVVFLSFELKYGNCEVNKELINLVVDFVHSQKLPVKVSAFLCWNSKISLDLIKNMNNKNIPISVNQVSAYRKKNIGFFQPAQHQMYLLDLDCEYSQNILANADNNYLLKPPFSWIILKSCENQHDFSQYKIFLETRIYVVRKCRNDEDKYEIDSVFNQMKNHETAANKVAVWKDGFEYLRRISDYKDRANQHGLNVNISLVFTNKNSANDLEHMKDKKNDPVTKHNYMLIACILDILNATPTYYPHRIWGVPDPKTGKYNGMVGDLLDGTAQMAGTPLFIVADKIPYVDYLADTAPTQGSFIFRAPPLSTVTNIFRLPFDSMVWLACFLILSLIFFVMYSINKWEWSVVDYQKIHGPDKTGVLKSTLMDIIQLEIGAVCQQGAEAEPKSNAGRVGFFFIFLSLMFIYTAYSANIVALLQSTTDSLRTLEDLCKSQIDFGAHDVGYNKYHMKHLKGYYQKMVYDRLNPDGFVSLQEGVERMRTQFYAFFAENDAIYKIVSDTFMEQEKCGLTEVKYWSINHPWMPIKKNSTFKEILKVAYHMMNERGLRDRNFKKLYSKKPTCQNQGANFTSVRITDCYFAVVVFVVGLILSIVILLIEKALAKTHAFDKIKSKYLSVGKSKISTFLD